MSIRFSSLNSPQLVAAAGTAVLAGLPALEAVTASSASLALLKGVNATAFVTNVISVSIPGRIDEAQDQEMRRGVLNPSKPTTGRSETEKEGSTESTPLADTSASPSYTAARMRTLVNPAGWAFAIWGPIYLGEAIFVTAQIFTSDGSALATVLPQVTAPFVAANIFQSLWCASFRPSYSEGWTKFVSPAMLAGTALSLSQVHAVGCTADAAAGALSWYFLPMSLHFGWTTAATLVNLNGSVAMNETTSDSTVIAVGHASALVAAALGIGVTLARTAPAYGLTVAWALAACADGMRKRVSATTGGANGSSNALLKGARVQKMLCLGGSAACVAAAVATSML